MNANFGYLVRFVYSQFVPILCDCASALRLALCSLGCGDRDGDCGIKIEDFLLGTFLVMRVRWTGLWVGSLGFGGDDTGNYDRSVMEGFDCFGWLGLPCQMIK